MVNGGFPSISHVKIWFIIQLKQPFISIYEWLFQLPWTYRHIAFVIFAHLQSKGAPCDQASCAWSLQWGDEEIHPAEFVRCLWRIFFMCAIKVKHDMDYGSIIETRSSKNHSWAVKVPVGAARNRLPYWEQQIGKSVKSSFNFHFTFPILFLLSNKYKKSAC